MVVKEIIYKQLLEDNSSLSEPFLGEYWPSSIWDCMRRQYYTRNYPIRPNVDQLRYKTLGSLIHEFIAKLLSKNETFKVISEVPVRLPHPTNNEIVIVGRADDILVLEAGKLRYVVEVKTVDDLRTQLSKGRLPRKNHMAQLNMYLRAFPNSTGILLYIDRSNFDMEEFQISFDPQLYNESIKRAETLHEFLRAKKLPPPEAMHNEEMKWMCKNCEFRNKCEKDEP
ncbi:MAG: hypothetical protein JZD40_05740 [Sulfolobus sp.]|nr:hypothetical protein [Sulfolobus sp.]